MKKISSKARNLTAFVFLFTVIFCIHMSKTVDDTSTIRKFKTNLRFFISGQTYDKLEENTTISQEKTYIAHSLLKEENSSRCESQLFGCFQFSLKKEFETKVEGGFTSIDFGEKASRNKCIEYCSERKLNYAGLRYSTCYCSNEVRHFMNIKNVDSCDVKCPGNPEDSCGGEDGVDLYFITSQCNKEPISLQQKLLGCFRASDDLFISSDEKWTISKQPTTLSCFAYCENKGYVISGYKSEQCLCGEFTSSFNLEQKVSSMNCSLYLQGNKQVEPANLWTLFKTSVEDKRCSEMKLKNGIGIESRVGLISAPSSGNTWTRYLLEKATGYFTGSVYGDNSLYIKGYLGKRTSDMVIIKDHYWKYYRKPSEEDVSKSYSAVILIVRNPYDTMIAEWQRNKSGSHTGLVDIKILEKEIAITNPMYLSKLSKSMTSNGVPLYVIVYEDLVKDPIGEIRKLLTTFAPLKPVLPDSKELEERLLCLSSQLTGFFKRKKQKLNYDQIYTKKVEEVLNEDIKQARKVLIEAGFAIPNYTKPVF